MIPEKFRWYEHQSILNIDTIDTNWHYLTYNDLARPNSSSWGDVLKERKAILIKNQGKNNDNTTSCQIEIYFAPYAIASHIALINNITYTPATHIFRLNFGGTFVPVQDRTWISLNPFGGSVTYNTNSNACLTYVNALGGNIYDFKLGNAGCAEEVMLYSNLTSKKSPSLFSPIFYDYTTPVLTTERGFILEKQQTYNERITYDQILYYRVISSLDIGATIVIQQFA